MLPANLNGSIMTRELSTSEAADAFTWPPISKLIAGRGTASRSSIVTPFCGLCGVEMDDAKWESMNGDYIERLDLFTLLFS